MNKTKPLFLALLLVLLLGIAGYFPITPNPDSDNTPTPTGGFMAITVLFMFSVPRRRG